MGVLFSGRLKGNSGGYKYSFAPPCSIDSNVLEEAHRPKTACLIHQIHCQDSKTLRHSPRKLGSGELRCSDQQRPRGVSSNHKLQVSRIGRSQDLRWQQRKHSHHLATVFLTLYGNSISPHLDREIIRGYLSEGCQCRTIRLFV